MRTYTLFTSGPRGRITNQTGQYRSGMWIAKVRAADVRMAYSHLARQQWTEHMNPAFGNRSKRSDRDDPLEGVLCLYGPEGDSWPWKLPRELDARRRQSN